MRSSVLATGVRISASTMAPAVGNEEVARHIADAGDGADGKDDQRPADRRIAPHMNDRNARDGLLQRTRLLVITVKRQDAAARLPRLPMS